MNYLIVGAGGHGSVVYDILRAQGVPNSEIFLFDARFQQGDRSVFALRIPGEWQMLQGIPREQCQFIVAIGDNQRRFELHMELTKKGHTPAQAIHPTATLSPYAQLGGNVVVCAHANIGPFTEVCDGAIINTGATVEHGAYVGQFTHVAPRAVLCGDVEVNGKCWIGAGATILNRATVRNDTIIGAGGLVLANNIVGPNLTMVGVPAKRKLKRKAV